MAVASLSCERIGASYRTLPAKARRAGRILREASADYWPQGSSGRGGGVHVYPSHLVNLLIVLAVAESIIAGPQAVQLWRGVQPKFAQERRKDITPGGGATVLTESRPIAPNAPAMEDRAWWLEGETLGEALEWLIHVLAKPGNESIRIDLRKAELVIKFRAGGFPQVEVSGWTIRNGTHYYHSDYYVLIDGTPEPDGDVIRETTLSLSVFEVAADLWADTMAHFPRILADSPTGSVPAAPRNENAALPGAASTRNKPRANEASRDQRRSNGAGGFSALPESILEIDRVQSRMHVERTGCLHPTSKEPRRARSESYCSA